LHWCPHLSHFFHRASWLILDTPPNTLSSRNPRCFTDRGSTQTPDIPLSELTIHYPILQNTDTTPFSTAYFNPKAGHCDAALATADLLSAASNRGIHRLTTAATQLALNILNGKSNGEEKARAWAWKSGTEWEEVRERAAALRRELRVVESEGKCEWVEWDLGHRRSSKLGWGGSEGGEVVGSGALTLQ
jgi:hypothetical protein